MGIPALQRVVGPGSPVQPLFEDGLPLGAFQAEAHSSVLISGQHAHHVRVMLELSALPGQEAEDEAHQIALRLKRAQQQAAVFGHRFEQVNGDGIRIASEIPDFSLQRFDTSVVSQLRDRSDGYLLCHTQPFMCAFPLPQREGLGEGEGFVERSARLASGDVDSTLRTPPPPNLPLQGGGVLRWSERKLSYQEGMVRGPLRLPRGHVNPGAGAPAGQRRGGPDVIHTPA